MKGSILAIPAVQGVSLYLPMGDGRLYRINAKDGRHEVIGKLEGRIPVTPGIRGDLLFLSITGQDKRDLRALMAYDLSTKKVIWQRPFRNAWSAPALSGETLYIGSEDGSVYAVDTGTGETRWRFSAPRQIRSSPVVKDNMVYAGSDDGLLYALDAQTGRKLWSFETGGSVSTAPVVAHDAVYAASYDRSLYCIDRITGQLRWKFGTEGSLYGPPAIHENQ
ncbi:MAG: PQQ-binding-like beta-propeller repeat protein, partial [candidate division Zixibacteria bacterium]|nr:PQQ-binding-like beta-propeller repeat protein [candidate division Zixibacteria bacterium]